MIGSTGTSNLFATASLARRIERVEAGLIEDAATAARRRLGSDRVFLQPVGGGIAAHVESGSPCNKLTGLGFEGVPDSDALDAIEREFARRGAAVQVEISTLAVPEVARHFTVRGYELVGFENVLGLALTSLDVAERDPAATAPSIEVKPAGPELNTTWLDTVATGFLHPDTFDGPPSHEEFERAALERIFIDTIAAPSFERFLAWRNGQVAGGGSLRIVDGVAQLCGAATIPEHRRHGVQSALLRHRLTAAALRGCDIAVVTTQPGSKSQQNVQRSGFTLLYARAILTSGTRHDPRM